MVSMFHTPSISLLFIGPVVGDFKVFQFLLDFIILGHKTLCGLYFYDTIPWPFGSSWDVRSNILLYNSPYSLKYLSLHIFMSSSLRSADSKILLGRHYQFTFGIPDVIAFKICHALQYIAVGSVDQVLNRGPTKVSSFIVARHSYSNRLKMCF